MHGDGFDLEGFISLFPCVLMTFCTQLSLLCAYREMWVVEEGGGNGRRRRRRGEGRSCSSNCSVLLIHVSCFMSEEHRQLALDLSVHLVCKCFFQSVMP